MPVTQNEWLQHISPETPAPTRAPIQCSPWQIGLARLAAIWHDLRTIQPAPAPDRLIRHAMERWSNNLERLHIHAEQKRRRARTPWALFHQQWGGFDPILDLTDLQTRAPHIRLWHIISQETSLLPLVPTHGTAPDTADTPPTAPLITPMQTP